MSILQDTDLLLVNRGGVDHSIVKTDIMATVQDTDVLLVNRLGVDYQATYADVKKGFGPQKITPAPTDWSFSPAIVSGDGSQSDPFIITPATVPLPGRGVQSAQTLTLNGLTPDELVEWEDHSVGAGIRFDQELSLVPNTGQVDLRLTYFDTPTSIADTVFTGDLQIGTTYFRWVVTQNLATSPEISSVVLADSPQPDRFTSGTFASTYAMAEDGFPASSKGLKAWVSGSLQASPVTSPITNVVTNTVRNTLNVDSLLNPACAVSHCRQNIPNISDGNIGTYGRVEGDAAAGPCQLSNHWSFHPTWPVTGGELKVVARLTGESTIFVQDTLSNQVEIASGVTAFTFDVPDVAAWLTTNGLKNINRVYTSFTNYVTSSFDFYELGTYESTVLTFADGTDLNNFAVNNNITEIGNGDNGIGRVISVDLNTFTMVVAGSGFEVGSLVKGPRKELNTFVTSDVITSQAVGTPITWSTGMTSNTGWATNPWYWGGPEKAFDGSSLTAAGCNQGDPAILRWDIPYGGLTATTSLSLGLAHGGTNWGGEYKTNLGNFAWNAHPAPEWFAGKTLTWLEISGTHGETPRFTQAFLDGVELLDIPPHDVFTVASPLDLGRFSPGDVVKNQTNTATGIVLSIDMANLAVSLRDITGTWLDGDVIIGPAKSSSSVRLYTVHDAAGVISDLQEIDPGFVTMTGNSPFTVSFPATLPTGNAPDVDLPAGTMITTEIEAVNVAAAVTKTSNTVTPA
jgi:hypothetical protein